MLIGRFVVGRWCIGLLTCLFALGSSADTLISRRVVDRVRARTVEVLSNGQIRGGGGVISKDGRVITAAHLLHEPGAKLEVIHPEIGRRKADLVAVDLGRDLALLQIRLQDKEMLEPLDLVERTPRRGERIFCFGPGLRNLPLMLTGMVAEDREVCAEYAVFDAYLSCYLIDGASPSMMSGGVWVNDDGEIVGVQNGRLNDDGMHPGGIAMAATPAGIRALHATGQDAATAGIGAWGWELWTASKGHIDRHPDGQQGIIVTFLRKGGPMEKSGVGLHDVITHLDDVPVSRRAEFIRIIRGHKPGEQLRLRILHADNRMTEHVITLEDVAKRWRQRAAEPNQRAAGPN